MTTDVHGSTRAVRWLDDTRLDAQYALRAFARTPAVSGILGAAMAACCVPARRAMRVEPTAALRHD